MANNWRKSIEITFPIQRYHPPLKLPGGATVLRHFAWLDKPKTYWGSHDGSDTYRHGGSGLSRSADFPCRDQCLPGGVLDSAGLHIPILDLDARNHPPQGLFKFATELFPIFSTYEYRFSFGEPKQLSLNEYKKKIIDLNKKERRMPKTWKKVEKATSFYDAMLADVPDEAMKAYFGPVEVKNWIDEQKKYL